MQRHVMTARRKAALRKAQLVSAGKRRKNKALNRRGLSKTGRKNLRKNIRNNPKMAAKLFGTAIFIGGTVGWQAGNSVRGTGVVGKYHSYRQRKKFK